MAVCLQGLMGGGTTPAAGAYESKFEYLVGKVSPFNPDFFIHSWEPQFEEGVSDILHPVSSVFEPQKDFIDQREQLNCSHVKEVFDTHSFFYSRNKSIELKKAHEDRLNFKYDIVLVCRFDVGHHNQGKNKTSYLPLTFEFEKDKIYSAYWNQINAGPSDHWFYGDSQLMDIMGRIYYDLRLMLLKESAYHHAIHNGWPSSSNNEFSNELLSENKSEGLRKVSGNPVFCNNHYLYKWFFIKNNWWNTHTCRFLNKGFFNNE